MSADARLGGVAVGGSRASRSARRLARGELDAAKASFAAVLGRGAELCVLLMGEIALAVPLVVGAGMKLAYDALLYVSFRRVRPPEEESPA